MSELRAGGQAIVIYSGIHDEIGRSVELIERMNDNDRFDFPGVGLCGWEDATKEQVWLVSGNVSIHEDKPTGGYSMFPAKDLMPIDGEDFSHEDERQKELLDG